MTTSSLTLPLGTKITIQYESTGIVIKFESPSTPASSAQILAPTAATVAVASENKAHPMQYWTDSAIVATVPKSSWLADETLSPIQKDILTFMKDGKRRKGEDIVRGLSQHPCEKVYDALNRLRQTEWIAKTQHGGAKESEHWMIRF